MSQLKEFLTFKALAFKFSVHGGYGNSYDQLQRGIASGAITNSDGTPINEDQFDSMVEHRQTCAKLPVYLCEKLDAVCGMLDITKREFIELAVREALEIAEKTKSECNVLEFLADEVKA
jgi:hypothetical protein